MQILTLNHNFASPRTSKVSVAISAIGMLFVYILRCYSLCVIDHLKYVLIDFSSIIIKEVSIRLTAFFISFVELNKYN